MLPTVSETGTVVFDNIQIGRSLSLQDFLTKITGGQQELWMSNGESRTYRFLPAQSEGKEFILLLVFHSEKLTRLSISVNHPGATWEGETPEQIEQDGELLRQVMYSNFNRQNKNQQFNWGKVELWQDVKNAFAYSIVVTYSE